MKNSVRKSVSILSVLSILVLGGFSKAKIGTYETANIADSICANLLNSSLDGRNTVTTVSQQMIFTDTIRSISITTASEIE